MIEHTMIAIHADTRKLISNHGGIRLILAIAGILIAILCCFALLQDVRSAEELNASAPRLTETSRIAVSDFVGKTMAWL
jgi:hypothetical protein